MKLNKFLEKKVCVVDYEIVNIASIENAIKYLGFQYEILKKPKNIDSFSHMILPGVGSFREATKKLHKNGWAVAIKDFAKSNKPILGICLGMQLMFEFGFEDGESEGLGLFKGKCEIFAKGNFPLPHIGFNLVNHQNTKIWKNIVNPSPFYFVHSYRINSFDQDAIISKTFYGEDFVSFIEKENFYGAQFHPEKSGSVGLKLYENFLKFMT